MSSFRYVVIEQSRTNPEIISFTCGPFTKEDAFAVKQELEAGEDPRWVYIVNLLQPYRLR